MIVKFYLRQKDELTSPYFSENVEFEKDTMTSDILVALDEWLCDKFDFGFDVIERDIDPIEDLIKGKGDKEDKRASEAAAN